VLDLPNSFEPGDGLRLVTEGEGATKEAASEQACRLAFTRLLMERPGLVVLRPAHWKVSLDELMANISLPGEWHQALPVHVRARRSQLAREAASERYVDANEVWKGRVADLLRQILRRHRGSFDPSRISHKLMGLAPGEETTYSKLNKLLEKGELKPFVEQHSEFACQRVGSRMLITWAAGAARSSASAIAADSHSDADAAPSSASAIAADAHSDGSWVVLRANSAASDSDWASAREVGDFASMGTWEDVRESEDVGFDCFAQGFQ